MICEISPLALLGRDKGWVHSLIIIVGCGLITMFLQILLEISRLRFAPLDGSFRIQASPSGLPLSRKTSIKEFHQLTLFAVTIPLEIRGMPWSQISKSRRLFPCIDRSGDASCWEGSLDSARDKGLCLCL